MRKTTDKKWLKDPLACFSIVGLFMTIAMLVFFFITKGKWINRHFMLDVLDTGMDWFNSLLYTKEGRPYGMYSTLYPPLANLFFYSLIQLVPTSVYQDYPWQASYQEADIRLQQSVILPFILFMMLVGIILVFLIEEILKNRETRLSRTAAALLVFSFGFTYAVERGNILVLALALSLFFVAYYQDERAVMRELACIALALGAGLKLFPALFGILLLKDRQWKRATRTVIYGIASLIVPCFFLKDGLDGLNVFFKTLLGWGNRSTDLKALGCGFKDMACSVVCVISEITGLNVNLFSAWIERAQFLAYVLCGVLLFAVIMLKMSNWKQILYIALAIVSIQKAPYYTLVYMIIPFVYFLKEEKVLNQNNILYFLLFLGITLHIPAFDFAGPYKFKALLMQSCILGFWCYAVWDIIKLVQKRSFVFLK